MRLSFLWLASLTCSLACASEPTPRIVALVRADLHPDLENSLEVWQADLVASGYQAVIETWPVDQLETRNDNAHTQAIWQRLHDLHAEGAGLEGAIFVGRFPSLINRVETWDGKVNYYTSLDDGFWYLDSFAAKPEGAGLEPDIWVSRIDALDQKGFATHEHETTLLRRYFTHLHAWRCGRSRYPDAGYWGLSGDFNDSVVYDGFHGDDVRLDTLWGEHIEELYDSASYIGKNMANIFDTGGEYYLHRAHGFKNGVNTQIGGLGLFYDQPNQIRIYALGSCNVNEIGGMCARALFSRHGGTLYAGAEELSAHASFRVAWNNGDSLGRIMVETLGYPIQSYGDLTVTKTPSCFTGNQLPNIDSFTASSDQVTAGDTITFAASASDTDGIARYEVFPQGYDDGAGTSVLMTDPAACSHRYEVPHRYQPMLVVSDRYQACMWQEAPEIRVAPPANRPLRINCGYSRGQREGTDEYTQDDADYFCADDHRYCTISGTPPAPGDAAAAAAAATKTPASPPPRRTCSTNPSSASTRSTNRVAIPSRSVMAPSISASTSPWPTLIRSRIPARACSISTSKTRA